jgi:RNA polymerase sigma factor (sigma-70 family)
MPSQPPEPSAQTERLTASYSATLALLEQSAPLAVDEERALARRITAPVRSARDAARRRSAREALWQANLRLCWRVAVKAPQGEGDPEQRLDVFQTVALALWTKTEQYNPDRHDQLAQRAGRAPRRPARFGSYVMPTLRSVAARCRINDQPVRRPVWVVSRERQAARRVRAELAAAGAHWDDLSAQDAEARMLLALSAIADDLRAQAAATRGDGGTYRGSRAFRASAVLAHAPLGINTAALGYDGVTPRAYGAYAPGVGRGVGRSSAGWETWGQQRAGWQEQQSVAVDPFAAEEPSADAMAERAGLLESLSPETMALVSRLAPREMEVLRLRFEQNLELARIGELLDPPLTRARVGQILQEALAKLRVMDAANGDTLRRLL